MYPEEQNVNSVDNMAHNTKFSIGTIYISFQSNYFPEAGHKAPFFVVIFILYYTEREILNSGFLFSISSSEHGTYWQH